MTKLLVLFGFVLSFAAGMLASSRFLPPPPPEETFGPGAGPTTHPGPPFMRRGFLPRELDLTPEQQTKIREIWSKVGVNGPREMDDKKHEYGEAKDAEFAKLIPPERRADFDKIKSDFTAKMTALDTDFRESFENAIKQTEALLTPEQRQKYDEIRSHMQPHDGRGFEGEGHGHHGHGPGDFGPMMGPPDGFKGGPGGPPTEPRDGGKF